MVIKYAIIVHSCTLLVFFLPLIIDLTQVINQNLSNKMLGQDGPNSITQVMIYNLGYNL